MCGFARMGPTSISCSFKRKQAEHILILNTYKSQEKSMSWAVNLMVFLDLRKREFGEHDRSVILLMLAKINK